MILKPTRLFALACALAASTSAQAVLLNITVENLSPDGGTLLTPAWVGFHDGSFDLFDPGSAASVGLERAAEDGDLGQLQADFASVPGVDGVVFGLNPAPNPPVFRPGDVSSIELHVDPAYQYFNFVSMVIPSNDAFIGNGTPIQIFDDMGNFLGLDIIILGSQVWDAGTEVNDELPENTAALAQMMGNTGVAENGVVALHPGFLDGGNVLGAIPNGDFTVDGYQVARISVEVIPEPSTYAMIAVGFGAIAFVLLRRRKS